MDSTVRNIWSQLGRVTCSWWRQDRIRASPREGRLLRLEVGCLIVVDGRAAEVVSRVVGHTATGPYVLYHCCTAEGPGELWVNPYETVPGSQVRWIEGGKERILGEGDIDVFGKISRAASFHRDLQGSAVAAVEADPPRSPAGRG